MSLVLHYEFTTKLVDEYLHLILKMHKIPCLVSPPVYSIKQRTFSASTSEFIRNISSEVFDEHDAFNCIHSSVDEEFDCSRRVQSF